MIEIKRLFGQTVVYGFSSVLARVLNFLLVPLYTILFIPSEYAIVSEMYAYAALLMVFGSFGMETTFFRFANQVEDKKELYSTAAIILFFSSIICLLTGQIILQVSPPEYLYLLFPLPLVYIVWLFLITFIDTLCVLPFAKLRQEEKAKKFQPLF